MQGCRNCSFFGKTGDPETEFPSAAGMEGGTGSRGELILFYC